MPRKVLGEEPSQASSSRRTFAGMLLNDIYVLEIFAGTARLSKSLKLKGFQAMAFDKTSKRSEGQVILEADLSNREEVKALLEFIHLKADQIAFIHLAPPCGTSSRARGKRLRFLQSLNIKEPRPLRDDSFPDGFSWLSGNDKLRTEAANILYESTALIAQTAIELQIAICIENPSSSLMWKTTPFQQLFQQFPDLKFIHFHNCAHGGTRDKKTCFVTNVDWFDSLAIFCNKQHTHAPWTPTVVNGKVSFPTHSEAAYPEILCNRIASLLKAEMVRQGAIEIDDLEKQVKHQSKSTNRIVLGALPRGKQIQPLVSEFGTYINVIHDVQFDGGLQQFLQKLPKGSAIQSRLLTTWGEIRDAIKKQSKKKMLERKLELLKSQQLGSAEPFNAVYEHVPCNLGCETDSTYKLLALDPTGKHDDEVCEKVVVAIPREPLDFLERALEVGHPRGVAIQLPPVLREVMEWNRDADAYSIYKHRIEFVRFWTDKAKELKSADESFLQQAPAHLKPLLEGKRLAVWQAMLEHYEYPDKALIQDVVKGFPLTGWLPDSQVFPKDFRPPSMDVSTLRSVSKGINERVKAKVLASAASELTEATWAETEKELQEGWMEIDKGDGKDAAWALRFGLQQREKVRVIDDFSIAGVNHTAGLQERLKIFGIDDIAALVAYSLDSCGRADHPTLLGKTMDLKSAYKQFGVRQEDRERVRVATCHPTTAQFILLMVNALPFGATGSVSGFLRVSMFLWFLGTVGLKLAWTSFYDDYTMVSRADCANNAAWSAECLFDLLGIVFAKEGKKATSFDRVFGSLGVVFDLTCICQKSFSICHTESRRSELISAIQDLLTAGSFTSKAIERLRGRLLWFENFICGRQANILVAQLGRFVNGAKHEQPLHQTLKGTLNQLLERVGAGKPVLVSPRVFSTWICFTDGAWEERASVGAILVSPGGKAIGAFGPELPLELQKTFYDQSKHPIYEVELLPVLISTFLWKEQISQCQVVYYLDNDAAKSGLIKGSGATDMANAIVGGFCEMESLLQLKTWFSRVPTHSNLGDGPSRLDFSLADSLGCARCQIPWQEVSEFIWTRLSRNGALAGRG